MAEGKLVGLIGRPVSQSAGQFVYNSIFSEMAIDAFYAAIDLAPANLAPFLKRAGDHFFALNVTSPHKNTVLDFCDRLSPAAGKTQSVNLLSFSGSRITGDNLDVAGFENLIVRNNVSLNDMNVVIVGSGGAARSVMHTISGRYTPASLHVASRNPELTERKLEAYDLDYPVISYSDMFRLCDIVVNCTPESVERVLPPPPRRRAKSGVAIDLVYNPPRTLFLRIMEESGWRIINGEEMFIGQGLATLDKMFDLSGKTVEALFRKEFQKFRGISP
ncbi:MAG: shikimate dehydrogenase family protein [Thermoplasmata archaeon]